MANSIIISFNNDDIMSKDKLQTFIDVYGQKEKYAENEKICKQILDRDNFEMSFPLLEAITLDYQSQYQQLSDIFGIAGRIQNILTAVQSLGGTASSISNIFTYEMWKSTDPLALNFKTILYTKTNPALDVWYKSALISSQSIISRIDTDGGGYRYKLPGLSLGGATKFQEEQAEKAKLNTEDTATTPDAGASTESTSQADAQAIDSLNKKKEGTKKAALAEGKALGSSTQGYQKIVQVYIPGIIFIDKAMIVSAKPTYSRQTSLINGTPFPIWCEMDIQIKSVSPAHTGFYTEAVETNVRTLVSPDTNYKETPPAVTG